MKPYKKVIFGPTVIIRPKKKEISKEAQKKLDVYNSKNWGRIRFWRKPFDMPMIVITDTNGHSTIKGRFT